MKASEAKLESVRDCEFDKLESGRDCEFDKLGGKHKVLGSNCIIDLTALFYKF